MDLGDLPDIYGTTLTRNGARHILVAGGAYLGSRVDAELDGQPTLPADGDDLDGGDEDGVVFLTPLAAGRPALMQVTAGTAGYLSAFVDWNGRGTLSPMAALLRAPNARGPMAAMMSKAPDALSPMAATQLGDPGVMGGALLQDTELPTAGDYLFEVDVPTDAEGIIYLRFRFTNEPGQGGASPTGDALTGEVEDYPLSALGDYVWLDVLRNGIQDVGEPGVAGVTVHLLDGAGNPVLDGVGKPITTVTAANGWYQFAGLWSGPYRVRFAPPVGYYFTVQDQGGDEALDSDADPSINIGLTDVVNLAPAQNYVDLDAGLFYLAPSAVELVSFEAQRTVYTVRLRWETASELDVVGYDIYRAAMADRIAMQGPPESGAPLNAQLIAGQSLGGVLGGVYEWVDESAALGETYVYFLAVRERDGNVELYPSNVIEPGRVVRFWMPMTRGGGPR
jgi:hypothetical protein